MADGNLKELYTGIFTDLSLAEAGRRYPEVFTRFRAESWNAVPEAETVDELAARAAAHWRRLIDEAIAYVARSAVLGGSDGAGSLPTADQAASGSGPAAAAPARTGGRHGCTFVSVSHGGLIQWLIKTVSGGAMRWMPLFPIQNCGISHLRVTPVNRGNATESAADPLAAEGAADNRGPAGWIAEWRSINHIPY